jgi:hypothetical protein
MLFPQPLKGSIAMTTIKAAKVIQRAEARPLSSGELDMIAGGEIPCCNQWAYEVKCPIGNLLVLANDCGVEPSVGWYS